MDYSKVLQYHIDKKADVTVVCKEMDPSDDVSRFGTIRMDDDMRITEFEEKPMGDKIKHDFNRNLCDQKKITD